MGRDSAYELSYEKEHIMRISTNLEGVYIQEIRKNMNGIAQTKSLAWGAQPIWR